MEAVSLNGTVAFGIEARIKKGVLEGIHTQRQLMAAGSAVNDPLVDF